MEAKSKGDGKRVCGAIGTSGRWSWADGEEEVAIAFKRAEIGWER